MPLTVKYLTHYFSKSSLYPHQFISFPFLLFYSTKGYLPGKIRD
jgi:hypothetical protein